MGEISEFLRSIHPSCELDLHGNVISEELLNSMMERLIGTTGRPQLGEANFSRAQFNERADFSKTIFESAVDFTGTAFESEALFDFIQSSNAFCCDEARFLGDVSFIDAHFDDVHAMAGVTEGRGFVMRPVVSAADVSFIGASFRGDLSFNDVHTTGDVSFQNAIFNKGAYIKAHMQGELDLRAIRSEQGLMISTTWINGNLLLEDAKIGSLTISESAITGELDISFIDVRERATIEVFGARVNAFAARIGGRLTVNIRHGSIGLAGVTVEDVALIATPHEFLNEKHDFFDSNFLSGWRELPFVRIVALDDFFSAGLVLTDTDLSLCTFAGMHRPEQIAIVGAPRFGRDPANSRWIIEEERIWRRSRKATIWRWRSWPINRGAALDPDYDPDFHIEEAPLPPERLAATYRALRKSLEDSKNEPGAADFYYGEMEMRRLAPSTLCAERLILTGYWIASGYGLRSSRSLALLAFIIAVFAALFVTVGMPGHVHASFTDSLVYTASGIISVNLNQAAFEKLTIVGQVMRLMLRVLGPLLLGLALLAVRNRVKR